MIDDLDDMVDKTYQQFMRPIEENNKSIRSMARAMVGGSLVFAISMLAMKCDNTRMAVELSNKIQDNKNALHSIPSYETLERGLQDMKRTLDQEGFIIVQPCYTDREGYTEVRPC